MAPPKVANPKASAAYYRRNPQARAVKAQTTTALNATPAQRAKRAELARARRAHGLMGKGGPDLSHTSTGTLVLEDASTNRARNRGTKPV